MKEISPDPRRKRIAKGRPISTCIPTQMDEDKNERKNRKKIVEFVNNMAITEKENFPTCLHLKFFLLKCNCLSILFIMLYNVLLYINC